MKTPPSLRALFILAGFLVTLWIAAGAFLLILGYPRPDVTEPVWRSGQYLLLIGIGNLFIYGAIYWQVRKLLRNKSNE